MKGLTLDRLEVLRKLGESEGVLGAAEGSKSRQGLYSRQIRELEIACGIALVDRSNRKLRLNQKGEAVVQRYQRLLEEIGVQRKAKSEDAIRIGGGEVALVEGVMPLLAGYYEEIGKPLQFRNLRSADAIQDFRRGELDLVLSTMAPTPLREGEISKQLIEVDYLIVTHRQNELAPRIFLKTLLKEKLALLEGQTPIRSYLEREARQAGVPLNLQALCSTYGQIIKLVELGHFVGVIPAICGPAALASGLEIKRLISGSPPPFRVWSLHREEDGEDSEDMGRLLGALKLINK